MATGMTRDDYGTGSLYQRSSDWRWIGTVENGFNADGGRKRVTVSSKGCEGGCAKRCAHRAAIKRKLERKGEEVRRGVTTSGHTTVKQWADIYLEMRLHDLSPKGYNAAANPIRNWVVPTIGHRRLNQLTPADIRAVQDAQKRAGRQSADTHRALKTMLKKAVEEGHQIASGVLVVQSRKSPKSDRQAMTIEQGDACLYVASEMPNGSRWLFTLLYGQRMGECLGLTWDAVDFGGQAHGEAIIEWQLQPLPYITPRDRSSGFRVPDGHESIHLVDSYHLTRPKSRAGLRVAPFLEPVRDAMLAWRERAPESPHNLVWPELNGRPRNDKHDRAEWHALQERAGVSHPSGRPFHVHECRNFAATTLLEAGVDEHVITDLLGHSALATSLKYRTRRRQPLLEAMEKAGQRLQLERFSSPSAPSPELPPPSDPSPS